MNILDRLVILIVIIIILLIVHKSSKETYYIKPYDTHINFMDLFIYNCNKYSDKNALTLIKNEEPKNITYSKYLEYINSISKGLHASGCTKNSNAVIIGYNSPLLFISYLSIMMIGGVSHVVYYESSSHMCNYVLEQSNADILFVSNSKQLLKFNKKLLDKLTIIISLEKIESFIIEDLNIKTDILHWRKIVKLGHNIDWVYEPDHKNRVITNIYTSGTTGKPKPVPITNTNIMTSINNILYNIKDIEKSDERILSYMPVNHIAAQILDIYTSSVLGANIYFSDKPDINHILKTCLPIVRPTIFMSVPRIWEKIKDKIEQKSHIFTLKPLISYKLGFDKCKLLITCAAPIDKEILQFYNDINIPLTDIYGMTESTGLISYNGKIVPSLNYRFKNGVLFIKGKNVYKHNKKWFNTGDLGYINKDDELIITGRKKDIIITKGGENVDPIEIERNIKKTIPEVSNCVVIGNNRKYISALLTLNEEVEKEYLYYKIKEVNSKAESKIHTIKKWIVLDNKFKIDEELTNTLKLKRNFIENKYKGQIEHMYKKLKK